VTTAIPWADSRAWADGAICAQVDPNLFFTDTPGGSTAAGRRICAGCPAREACLEAALAEEHGLPADKRYGIRGALGPDARWAISRERVTA
jgi:WhiB family redox-sensing transcriptional regulator